MTTSTMEHPEQGTISYTDKKRYLWLSSVILPVFPMMGIALYYYTGSQWALGLPLFFTYGIIPFLDWGMGSDTNNPPEEIVPQLEEDRYYRILTYITVPMHFLVLIGFAWFVGSHASELTVWSVLALALTAGTYSGLGINTAHEMGHKKPALSVSSPRSCWRYRLTDTSALSTTEATTPTWRHLKTRLAHAWANPSTNSYCVKSRVPFGVAGSRRK